MKKIAIFASGSGSNAQAIIEYLLQGSLARVDCILSNKSDAYVLTRAKKLNIDTFLFTRQDLYESDIVLNVLKYRKIDFIVLAGFLWLVPENLIRHYPKKIINIHPALLPKYGGKGMFGMKVHKAVIDNKEKESGISIHYVNENYDEGNTIYQAKCEVEIGETTESLALKIHALEYKYFPVVIEKLVAEL
jgi:phosphoribosylglycinamide formyltransferase-1